MSRRLYVGLLVVALLIGLPMAVNALGGPELAGTEPAGSGADTTAVGTTGAPGTTYEPGSQPNIVFISADDMTLDEMRYLPRVKRLLGQAGVTFTDFTAPQPLCCPSRAQQLTGQYAQNNGVRANSGRYGGYDAFKPETAMPVWLQQAGYHTAMVGKYLNGYKGRDAKEGGVEVGWDHWDPTIKAIYQYLGYGQYNNGDRFRPQAYHTDYVARRSARLIEEMAAEDTPFFLWTSFVGPHGRCPVRAEAGGCRFPPVVARRHRTLHPDLVARARAKPSFNEKAMDDKPGFLRRRPMIPTKRIDTLQRARAGALAAVDEGVETIVQALRASGSADNTLVVFTSDNGYLMGEHRYQGKILGYEEAIRVPLVMAGLGLPQGVQDAQTAAMIDLAPTFAELAGATPLIEVDGAPIHVRTGPEAAEVDDRTLLIQAGASNLKKFPTGWWFRGVRTSRYTYVRYERDGFVELYDRDRDPFQLRNRADDPRYREVRTELAKRAFVLTQCNGSDCRPDLAPVMSPQQRGPAPGAGPLAGP
jgi:N-acetylglucosamine-6-sulfatase